MERLFKRIAVILTAFAAISFAGLAGAAEMRTVLVLGDSLSAAYGIDPKDGWVSLLGQRLTAENMPWKVVNASISGDTTAGGLSRLPRELATHKPALVVIELGGNDGLRGLPVDVMRSNLEKKIALARAAGASVLLLGMQIPPNYGAQYADRFAAAFRDVAKANRAALVPFFLDGIAENRSYFQNDGIHPTREAQSKLLDNVWPALKPLLAAKPGSR